MIALDYLHQIERVLAVGGWTDYETIRLRKLRRRWECRASGKDPRFEAVGTRGGRLPSDQEYALRRRRRAPRVHHERQDGVRADALITERKPQDQRWNRWHEPRIVDADLPTRPAKGLDAPVDPDLQPFEPEPGELAMPKAPAPRQYLIPGQDTKGHAQRVYCRVMPAHYRAMCAVERSKAFGFRTIGDLMRWCIDFGLRELTMRARVPQAVSALTQVDAIREVLLDEQYYMEFPQLFEQMTATINRHLSAGAEGEAIRLIGIVRHQIEQMQEPYWREKYMTEFMRHYGTYLDGTRGTKGLEFGSE